MTTSEKIVEHQIWALPPDSKKNKKILLGVFPAYRWQFALKFVDFLILHDYSQIEIKDEISEIHSS